MVEELPPGRGIDVVMKRCGAGQSVLDRLKRLGGLPYR